MAEDALMTLTWRNIVICVAAAVVALAVGIYSAKYGSAPKFAGGVSGGSDTEHAMEEVELSQAQLQLVKVGTVEEREFLVEREAIGSIDFNQDLLTPVFTP